MLRPLLSNPRLHVRLCRIQMPIQEIRHATIESDAVFLFIEVMAFIRHAQIFDRAACFADRPYQAVRLGHGVLRIVDAMLNQERHRYFCGVLDRRILFIEPLPAFFSDIAILDAVRGF